MGVDLRFLGFILTQWGMQFFHSFSMFFIVFAFAMVWRYHWSSLHIFPCLLGFSLSFSLNFHAHLWSTAKLNCLSLRRWTTLAMPGWQAARDGSLDGQSPTRASDDIFLMKFDTQGVHLWTRQRGGERPWLCFRPSGGWGATSFSNLFHGGKTWKSFRSSFEVHVPSNVEYHHNLNESICWVHLQGRYMSISRICWKFNRCLLTSLDQIRNKPG